MKSLVKRGLCALAFINKAKVDGRILPVKWNYDGQVVKTPHFICYIDLVARTNVPISLGHWGRATNRMREII